MCSKSLAGSFRLLEIEIAEKGLENSIKAEVLVQLEKLDALIKVMEGMEPAGAH